MNVMTTTNSNGCSYCALHFRHSPLKVVRAAKQFLYDDLGTEYLDCVNSAAHVGHCHPHVVAASQAQMLKLWSAQGFLNDTQSKYLKGLIDTLPDSLSVIYLVNSGSEANDLALRLARQYTKREDVVVFEDAYHGNLSSLVDISHKTFKLLPQGKKKFVHTIPVPKLVPNGPSDIDQGPVLFQRAKTVLESELGDLGDVSCFISEILPLSAGVVIPPKSYFKLLYTLIREKGGLCIADEVQTGLGRTGEHFWAFQSYGVVPDIVTIGRPLGNGYPLGAVITSKEVADCLGEYMTTFGGNPVACSIGLAVLEVIRNEKLMSSARFVGKFLLEEFRRLQETHPTIGDVRGMGLFLGVEMVVGRPNLKPASELAKMLAYRLKDEHVVIGVEGPDKNVMVVTPPLCFTLENARRLIDTFDKVLIRLETEPSADDSQPSLLGLTQLPSDIMSPLMDDDVEEPSAKRQRVYEEMD